MFKKYNDALSSLGVGQKVLIEDWLNKKGIKKYTINEDLSLDINEFIDIDAFYIDAFHSFELPSFIKINHVKGYYMPYRLYY